MIKTSFEEFVNEQYTLTIEDSMDDFDVQEVNWESECNVSDIWNKYSQDKNVNEFIENYKKKFFSSPLLFFFSVLERKA